MFDFTVRAFRFGNVVGPSQTHGVGFDFVRRLLDDPTRLRILGDGTAEQVLHPRRGRHRRGAAGAARRRTTPFDAFNVATGDYITVTEIAELAMEVLGLEPGSTRVRLHRRRPRLEGRRAGGADRDRPRSARSAGPTSAPAREALRDSMTAMLDEARAGLLDA